MIKWPYRDVYQSGYVLQEHKFYGIGDSGSMYCSHFSTRESAVAFIKEHHLVKESDIGTKGEDLGDCMVTVLSGKEYVEELIKRKLINEDGEAIE